MSPADESIFTAAIFRRFSDAENARMIEWADSKKIFTHKTMDTP